MKYLILLLSLNVNALDRIVVLDTGLDLNDKRFTKVLCKDGHKDFSGQGFKDTQGHGTMMAGLIKRNMNVKKYCLSIVKFDTKGGSLHNEINYINTLNAKLVNISINGPGYDQKEFIAFRSAPRKTRFIIASGNKNQDLKLNPSYPAAYPLSNIVVVGSTDFKGNYGIPMVKEAGRNIVSESNNGGYEVRSGTSLSTAIYTGKIAK